MSHAHRIDTDDDRRIGHGSLGACLHWRQFAYFRNFLYGALLAVFRASLVTSDCLGQRELLLVSHDNTQKEMNDHVMHSVGNG